MYYKKDDYFALGEPLWLHAVYIKHLPFIALFICDHVPVSEHNLVLLLKWICIRSCSVQVKQLLYCHTFFVRIQVMEKSTPASFFCICILYRGDSIQCPCLICRVYRISSYSGSSQCCTRKTTEPSY